MGEEPITEQQALTLAALANARATPEERALSLVVVVREKATGKLGLMHLWNEEEVDRRLELLKANLEGAPEWYVEEVGIQLEHQAVRRAAWEKKKDEVEIILSSRHTLSAPMKP